METVSCNVDECDNSVSMENKVRNTKKKRKRSKEGIGKEKQELDQKDGEILTRSNDARADPSGSEVGVVSVSNVETVEEKEDGTVHSSGSEVVDAVNEEKNKKKKVKRKEKKNKKPKLDTDKLEEDGSAKVLQDADVNHLDNSVPLQDIITDKEKVGVLGEGNNSVSMEMKKKKKKLRKRKNKEPEGESGSSNVNELQVEKSVETNNVSVETSSTDVKVLQDVDVNLVDTSVPLQGNVSLVIDKEKVGVLGEGDDVSVETKKKKKKKEKSRNRKNKEQEGAFEGCNANELQVEKSLESNQVSAEMSSINAVPSEDLDEENCRKRSRLDGSLEGNLDSFKEDVQDKETKKKEKLRRKGKQRNSKEQESKSGSSNVNELHAEKCVENNQVSVEMSNVNVTNNEDFDEENCRKRCLDESLKGNLESSMEDIQGRSSCSVDKGKKVESLGCTLGQVEVREQASSKQTDAEMSSINVVPSEDLDEENCRKRSRLDGSLEGNLDSSKEDVQDKETKKKEKLRRQGKQRKSKEQEGKSGSSNVNELHAEKCVENNQVSVEMSNVNVTNNEDLDEENCRKRCLDESLKGNLESSMEDIQGRSSCSVDKGKKVESLGCTLGQVEVREQASSKQTDAEMSSINVVPSEDLDEENCRKRSRLDGSLEGNLFSSKEDVQYKETKKKEKLRRKGKQRKSREQEGKSGSSNVNELHAEKCVENNQVSVEMSNVNVTNNEDLDEENCRKRCLDESLKGNLESSMEDIQGRSPCSVDKGKKVDSLGCTLGQVEVREQASSKPADAENSCLEISTKNSKGKFLLIDSQEGVNLPISRRGIREVTLSKDNCVAETSGEKNDVEQQIQDQLVPQTQTDNNSEAQDGNSKGESNALCCARSNNSVLQTYAMVNTDSTVAVCPSKKVVSKDDVVSNVIDKENRTIQHVQHSLTASIEVKPSQKKLLILDVNGLLADIVQYENRVRRKPDAVISGKAVFKRPFVDDFLQFCFDNFAVGVWSSRTKRNVEMVVNFLMGNSREKLLFCWDQSHCTITKFTTIQNRDKPLVFKELKKLWEKHEPHLPWVKGEYNESNTLLLDDSPYKALLNAAHTAIFPYSYEYTDSKDNSLGPGGDLRVYLERLALAKDVQEYVQWHPFGQRAITSRNPSWGYYEKVLSAVSSATATVLPH